MPIYCFQCTNKNCGIKYEVLTPYDASKKYRSVKCPYCQKSGKKVLLGNFSLGINSNLMRENHDYRFHHNLPKVLKERENAERAAKNPSPYNKIDDIQKGKYFGEVE